MNAAHVPRTTHNADAGNDPAGEVHRFVRDLIDRYRHCQGTPGAPVLDQVTVVDQLASLTLAEAAIRLARSATANERPPQLAVVGPTQVGKSTIVNLLLGCSVAEVSPLAGFTVQPQAFWFRPGEAPDTWAQPLFPGWRSCPPEELKRDELETYALRRVDGPAADTTPSILPPCVVWDTPDFDSLSAGQYQRGVLESAALADAYLLVLSKEKYSDLSVWKMLRLLEPLGRPLVICLNKLTPDSAEVVEHSLRERLAEFGRTWGQVPIVTVAYDPEIGSEPAWPSGTGPLTEAAGAALGEVRRDSSAGLRALVNRHWEAWTTPVRVEHAAIAEWGRQVEAGVAGFLERYKRGYLEHPERYDAFRRAAVELLHLLEIPRLSGWIVSARRAVTWPLRQLWSAGRTWRESRRGGGDPLRDLGPEAAVLFDAVETLLAGLQREVARRCDSAAPGFAVWRALGRRLEADEERLRRTFRRAIEAHHGQVTREVQVVANELYEQLQRRPARLAALRTARATLDVGGLLLVVKTGGLTPIDVLWAPATFALSSMLMESFAGVQMAADAGGLKKRQYEAVQKTLGGQILVGELRGLAGSLSDEGLFGILAEQLATADGALRAWEQRDDG